MNKDDLNFLKNLSKKLNKTENYSYDYDKIYLNLENEEYNLDEFKEWIKFIFNDKEDVDNLKTIQEVVDYVQQKHPDFLDKGEEDYTISYHTANTKAVMLNEEDANRLVGIIKSTEWK